MSSLIDTINCRLVSALERAQQADRVQEERRRKEREIWLCRAIERSMAAIEAAIGRAAAQGQYDLDVRQTKSGSHTILYPHDRHFEGITLSGDSDDEWVRNDEDRAEYRSIIIELLTRAGFEAQFDSDSYNARIDISFDHLRSK